jgi:hypothetical protein
MLDPQWIWGRASLIEKSQSDDIRFLAMGFNEALRKISWKVYAEAALSSPAANRSASDSEIMDEFALILDQLRSSSINDHFDLDIPPMRKS